MNELLIAARAVHFAATAITAGIIIFLTLVAEPSFRAADGQRLAPLRLQIVRIAGLGLALTMVSAAFWVLLEAADMSGRPIGAAIAEGVIGTVLTKTHFGIVTDLRLVLAAMLAVCLRLLGRRRWTNWTAPSLGAALLCALAWTGHAAADEGLSGDIHVLADALHLFAAGMWIGSLMPLILVLITAHQQEDPAWAQIACDVTVRFSTFGIFSVGTLLVTGSVNTWFLAGTLPALIGTDYGRLLVLKIALFALMVSIAATNRLLLTPRLSRSAGGELQRDALRQLTRNSVVEIGLGLIIFTIVGALGTLPPGLHVQPVWPLPIRLNTDVLTDPASSGPVLTAVALTAVGLAVIVVGLLWRRMRWSMIVGGAIVTVIFGQYLKDFISEAYPTSFYVSPTGYSTASIARGRKSFVEYCSACHGPTGHGDGPAGANMAKKPANLVTDHIYAHTDGDLFWWITHGMEDAMPGFGEALDDAAQWNLIDFIHANADAARLGASPGAVSLTGYPIPNFSVQCPDGLNVSIEAWRGRMIHIIVAGIDSAKQLKQFSERDRAAEVSTILIALNTSVAPEATACVADDEDVVETFALYRGESVSEIEGTEFLIDASGSLRAVWYPGVQPDWKNPRVFNEVIERMRRTPAQQRSRVSHVHG